MRILAISLALLLVGSAARGEDADLSRAARASIRTTWRRARPTARSGTRRRRPGKLGRLDPATGKSRRCRSGEGSAPHGVIVGPDGAAWVTDGGLNAIVRVDPRRAR